MEDLTWKHERVSKGFDELFRNGFSSRCPDTSYVLIPNFLKWNPISNENVAKARYKEFLLIPKGASIFNGLVESVLKYNNHLPAEFETLLKRFRNHSETLSNSLSLSGTIPEPKPEPDIKKENTGVAGKHSKKSNGKITPEIQEKFDDFWSIYPHRKGDPKKPALLKFAAALKRGIDSGTIAKGVEAFSASVAGEDPQFIPQAVTWLNQERWADDYETPKETDPEFDIYGYSRAERGLE